MSNPPKYATTVDDEESVGLLPLNRHAYPPSAAAASSSDGPPRSVVYHLRAEYPVTDVVPHQQAVSALGKSREETVQLVLEAFPDLQQLDDSRLEFYIPSNPTESPRQDIQHYARISGPAWAGLSTSVVRIGVKDLPGEAERRRRKNCNDSWIVAGILTVIALVVISLIAFFVSLGATTKTGSTKLSSSMLPQVSSGVSNTRSARV